MRNLLILFCLLSLGCDNRSPNQITLDNAKVIFTETFHHIKNPSFDDSKSSVDGNKVKLMVVYKGTDNHIYSQLVDVVVVTDEKR